MPAVAFTHPLISPGLIVETGANSIAWSYNLNIQAYPTYGGEVVQVLSTNIDNLVIQGEVRDYATMENIYHWFLRYMRVATQGTTAGQYSEIPVTMTYAHRGWTMQIQPIAMPGLHYGREVVVPTWQVQAHIVDTDTTVEQLTLDQAMQDKDIKAFGKITGEVGWRFANPWSDPLGLITPEEANLLPNAQNQVLKGKPESQKRQDNTQASLTGIGNQLQSQFNNFANGDFSTLFQIFGIDEASQPTTQNNTKTADNATSEKRVAP